MITQKFVRLAGGRFNIKVTYLDYWILFGGDHLNCFYLLFGETIIRCRSPETDIGRSSNGGSNSKNAFRDFLSKDIMVLFNQRYYFLLFKRS